MTQSSFFCGIGGSGMLPLACIVRARGERVGRNPRTGDEVSVPHKVVPYFKTGKELRERLNVLN